MQALEVRHLGCISRLDQRLEAHLGQFYDTTAEHGLLSK
ncbi:MAG: hypothetical protein AW09_001841 [Candidatus Accumulibacter phosphatis]|uniref:Uncharacterized protein n=1 Tax=Candidatus Accumulibacter phosphatis TaxID=327160 RepID=A0A080LYF0_9PROT|nr:MAG: hypothetical protein AW09_001841 [Candidatus Accumulibacter phosphatis]